MTVRLAYLLVFMFALLTGAAVAASSHYGIGEALLALAAGTAGMCTGVLVSFASNREDVS